VAVGLSTGRLDRQVLTQSSLSMRYRWEYWQGAWGVITEQAQENSGASTFWSGVGRAVLAAIICFTKLPQSSEEIQDPHDLFSRGLGHAGLGALLALSAALALAVWNLLGPAAAAAGEDDNAHDRSSRRSGAVPRETPPTAASGSTARGRERLGWLTVSAGLGLVMVLLVAR